MKILIAPLILQGKSDPNKLLTDQLVALFTKAGHSCLLSAPESSGIKNVHLYPCPLPRKPIFKSKESLHYYEDVLSASGCLSQRYLRQDYASLSEILDETMPDLIITIDRIAPVIFARNRKIKCWSFVQSDMYKRNKQSHTVLKDLNIFLSNWNITPVTHIHEIFKMCDKRIGFGPIEISPFTSEYKVDRIGISSLTPAPTARTNRVLIYLNHISKSKSSLEKLIKETFLGAPYSVYAWFPGCEKHTDDNIHFLSYADMKYMNGAMLMVHDGSSFYVNQCIVRGVLQLVVHNHDYERFTNAFALKHTRTGLEMFEEELCVATLYELYRKLVTDDRYYNNVQTYKKLMMEDGDLTHLLPFLTSLKKPVQTSFIDLFTQK